MEGQVSWDTQLPEDLSSQWRIIAQNADGFTQTIPKCFSTRDGKAKLAVFTDASETAMATCSYLFDDSRSSLIMAKCRLPSIRSKPTIPKMEMNALTMAVRLTWAVFRASQIQPDSQIPQQISIFSDPKNAHSWLSSSPTTSNAGVFVRNRLKETRKIVSCLEENGASVRFGYVNTHDNPADAGKRGLTQDQLQNHKLWWEGREFLHQQENNWSITFYPYNPQETRDVVVKEATINTMSSRKDKENQ
ncbi:unnamed protein product [Heligmosomoides polygyrus]|uniref:RNase H domain-containing protein n=1 Tax=Heligmosomoides polygyrus TaxID=6339 RepID=A0A183GTC5_HELPZ|nr:unnamed protein product [Heligmosomoides polygyrus]